MSPDAYCQKKAAESGSSFYTSFRFLSPERRRAITALYAYCREIDDVVDECEDMALAQELLTDWRHEIDAMLAGQPSHPVTVALYPHLPVYNIQGKHLHALIDGMQMDLNQRKYPDFEALSSYCWHVAGVVGLLAANIFGATQPQTMVYAEKLGLAFQLTNIIRDVGDDVRLGRIYLPEDEMAQFGVSTDDILNLKHTENFARYMAFMAKRAHAAYDEAFALLPREDRKAQKPGLIMAEIYRALLVKIEAGGFRVLEKRTSLSPLNKLWLAWKAYVRN
ncbi:presqualene diphosphate synthase HpnD [Oxalobacter vibrioformis]|uniref:Presqualene diphosphate synthase HpnD n=1 Tax=Oxalobacter vibrioformis TaxID=933080 RepID=A0A9E9LWR2_9BURK|nr:presqualene diphosphate synthase HpnD [Oxalobacter vibrioformis]WAW10264.1 presqualene diphosphate synthase HpnD [Oxalobacter vibrioformis]